MKNNLALIIPTKDRYEDLNNLFNSLMKQSHRPGQVIVVDASQAFDKDALAGFLGLNHLHVRASAAGTAKQKNEGKRYLDKAMTLVGFLDDDVVLDEDALEIVLKYFENAPADLGGISLNIKNYIPARMNLFTRMFLINLNNEGKILASGYNEPFFPVDRDRPVEWLPSGTMVWKRPVVDEYSFDENFSGYGLFEEVEYSYKIGKKYKMVALRDARLEHRIKPIGMRGNYTLSVIDVLNRYYLVKKYPEKFSLLPFYWSTLGSLFGYLFLAVLKRDRQRFYRVGGYLSALFRIITGNYRPGGKIR